MPPLWRDLLVAVRLLRQSPGLAIAATLTLALGIGANATIYSFADAVLFRPLDVPDADRIVHVFERRNDPGLYPLSYADFPHIRDHARRFEAVAAHYPTAPLNVLIGGAPEAITGAVATASYFDVLQLRPALGRFFSADEDRARDRDAVAVISHGFWQRRYAGEASVLGSTLTINDRTFTIVGVAPEGFSGVQARGPLTDLWIPAAMFRVGYRYCDAFDRSCAIVQLLGRLRRDASVDDAQRELDVLAAQLDADAADSRGRQGVTVVPARGLGYSAASSERRQLNLFLGVVTLVLVITCANVAGLLLARATARRRDIAVRFAIGASRGRIVGHVLAESMVLSVLGGGAGLLAATWGTDLLASLYAHDSAGRPLMFDLTLNAPVMLAALGLTLLTALVAGGIPAWQASRADLIGVLKDEGASGGARRTRLRTLLVSAQVAVTVVLLVGATLLVESAQRAFEGPGLDPEPVITLRLRPSLVNYSRERAHAFQREVVRTVESLPGVISASPSVFMSMFSAGARVAAATVASPRETVDAIGNPVGPRYFETIGVRLIEGREFTDRDRVGASPVAIVNDVLARRLWPDRPAVGQTIFADGRPHSVLGVVRDAQYYATGDPPRPQVFFSYWQAPAGDAFSNDSRTFVRVAGDPSSMMPAIRRAIAAVDASVPISEAHPLRDRVAYVFQPVRMARGMLTAFASLALVLSAVGLYGVLALSVAQRTSEIGLRIALGATRRQIAAMVLRDGMMVTSFGLATGLLAAWHSMQLVASLLFGLEAGDLTAFIAAPALLAPVALGASYFPARRAARVSPLTPCASTSPAPARRPA